MRLIKDIPRINAAHDKFGIKNAIGWEVGDLMIFSGYAGIDLASGDLTEGAFAKHANDSIDCFEEVLKAQGLGLDNVIKVKCYLQNPKEDFRVWNEIFMSRFNPPIPSRTTVGAALVVGLIELEMVASRTTRMTAD